MDGAIPAAWTACRYRWLLPAAARGRRAARAYADLVARVEVRLDRDRRARAVARIRRWLACTAAAADRIHTASLRSEALEEADSAFFMRAPGALAGAFLPPTSEPAHGGAVIYVTMHFGSPVLAYLYVQRRRGIDTRLIARPLSDANPMPAAKRAFAERKVAWVGRIAGRTLLATDATATAQARDHLLAGVSLFAAIDVPGDVVARSAAVSMFGETILVSAGLPTLARLAGASLQPMVAVSVPSGIAVRYGRPVAPGDDATVMASTFVELSRFVAEDPGEWWLWPYVVTPPGGSDRR